MGLEKAGSSTYRQNVNSGLANIGAAGTGGRGKLLGATLEMSNVDLAQEFTNLIIAQRGFQANSRVLPARDDNLQRTEERSVGNECVSTCISKVSSYHYTSNTSIYKCQQ